MAMKRVGGMMRTRTCINDAGTRPMHNWLRRSYGHGKCSVEDMDVGFRYVIILVRLFVNLIVCRPCVMHMP